MIALQSILFLFFLLPNGSLPTCGDFKYLRQPPTMLDCDPLGAHVTLQCTTGKTSNNVTWYWTQSVSEAGVSGTAILTGDTSDNYQVSNISTNIREIGFTVSESTLGYYWCEISNAVNVSLRPSTITPVCIPISSSHYRENKCNGSHILDLHYHDTDECAEEDSPTVISRPPLLTSCAGSPTSTFVAVATTPTPSAATMTSIVNPTMNTNSVPQQSFLVSAVVTVGVLVVVLVVLVVIIFVLVCVVKKSKAAGMKDGEKRSNEEPVVLNQQSLLELENVYYSSCDHSPNMNKQEAVPEYSVVSGSKGQSECTVPAGNTVTNRGEQPEYEVVNMTSEQQLPPEEKESPPHPANGVENLNASPDKESQELSPTEETMPVYAQPDLSKKKKTHSPILNTSEYAN